MKIRQTIYIIVYEPTHGRRGPYDRSFNFDIILQIHLSASDNVSLLFFTTVTVKDDLFKNLFSLQFSSIYLPVHHFTRLPNEEGLYILGNIQRLTFQVFL